jgi:uncharacterized membrane protein HdeD (DUF308 family)
MKNFGKSSLFTSILLFFLGMLLIFQSEATITTISYIIGAILIAAGAFALIRYVSINTKGIDATDLDILYGIVSIILGILIITNPYAIANIIPIILGIAIIISSATKIQCAFNLKNANNEIWKATMVIAIISTICGVVLLFNPFAGAVWIMRIVGVFISIYSILDLISTFIIKKNVEQFQVIIENETVEAQIIEEKDDDDNKKEVKSKPKKKTTNKNKKSKKDTKNKEK